MLWRRVLTGVVGVPILLRIAVDDGWLFTGALLAVALLGTGEALWMARQAGHRPIWIFALLLSLVLLAGAGLPGLPDGQMLGPALGLVIAFSLAVILFRPDHHQSLTDWALTLALPLYVGGLLQFFIPLRQRHDSGFLSWPALVLIASWSCDIAAYFAGRAFGRHRLAPSISPAKSVEGAIAGLGAATLVGALLSFPSGIDVARMAGFGLAVGIGSVVGDLIESWLKRQCGVKDSGFIMPGHGGILDRMDALVLSAALAYFYLRAVR